MRALGSDTLVSSGVRYTTAIGMSMSNATNLKSYRQRKRNSGYMRLDVRIPPHCWRNLQEFKTDFDADLGTVLIRLLSHRRRSRGSKNVREAFCYSITGSTAEGDDYA